MSTIVGGGIQTPGGGPIIIVTPPGGLGPPVSSGSGGCALIYNSKTILLGSAPKDFYIDPHPPTTVTVSLTGEQETIIHPRVDIRVTIQFPPWQDMSSALRIQLDNWWQWVKQGNQSRFVFDQSKVVKTTLSSSVVAGAGTVDVTDASGIIVDEQYVLIGGPNYQLFTVTNLVGNTVTVDSSLDFAFPSGAMFRDEYLWDFRLRDPSAECPVRPLRTLGDIYQLNLEFYEDIS